jgi:hypothetical protein
MEYQHHFLSSPSLTSGSFSLPFLRCIPTILPKQQTAVQIGSVEEDYARTIL